MKTFRNTGYKLVLEGPFKAESKEDLLFEAQDYFINYLIRLHNFSLNKSELLSESRRMCDEFEKYIEEVREDSECQTQQPT